MPAGGAYDGQRVAAQRGPHSAIAAAMRMLECYAAGFERDHADTLDEQKIRGPLRVSIGARHPDESDDVRLRTSIGQGVIRVAPITALDGDGDGSVGTTAAAKHYQACVAHAIAHVRYSRPATPVGSRGALRIAVASLIEDARVERLLMREYPGLHDLWGAFHTASAEHGSLSFASLAARLARALHDPGYEDPNEWVRKGRELYDEIAARHEGTGAYEEVADILAVDLAQMRVRFDPSSYCIEPPYRDDNTYLWAIETEAAPMKMERAPDAREQATARSSAAENPAAVDAPPSETETVRAYRYPEWHARVGCLFQDWTCVYDRQRMPEPVDDHDGVRRHPSAARQAIAPWWKRPATRVRRQFEGDDLDLGALIEHGIARRMGLAGDGKIFEQRRRTPMSMSVMLLLDFSASTNDAIEEPDTTVLDIEKEAATTIASAVESTSTRVALHGFASNGRHDVRYVHIKDFDEPFGDSPRKRLQAQQGAFSTRMGAALRHAATLLENEPSEAKWLILVTDGEPSDVDVHDSSHLIEDARHAVSELSTRGIVPFCFAFDRDAGRYVRTIFGSNRYRILDSRGNLAWQVSNLLASRR